jgi:hypothetical protein
MPNSSDPRALHFLGRRVERLIFAGILLIVVCSIDTYLATASRQLAEDSSASALTALLNRLESQRDMLTLLFQAKPEPEPAPQVRQQRSSPERERVIAETRQKLGLPPAPPPAPPKPPKPRPKPPTYAGSLDTLLEDVVRSTHSTRTDLSKFIDSAKSPDDLIKVLRQQRDILEQRPTNVWGVETPRLFALHYGGLEYKFPSYFISSTLTIALAPLLIGWLGALYATRQRELMMIAHLDDYKLAFPHILNFLPVNFQELAARLNFRKKVRNSHIDTVIARIALSLFRSCVVLLFSAPMVLAFIYSTFQLWILADEPVSLAFTVAVIVIITITMQSLLLVLQEWLLLHRKLFFE